MATYRYRDLIKPLPLRLNLANADTQDAIKACQPCSALVPNRLKMKDGLIKTRYERVDVYPDFPKLKESGKTGCGLCRLIRKTIRSSWAIRPMEEWGVGPLSERDRYWEDLLSSKWDRQIRIHNATFSVTIDRPMVVSLSIEFGPLSLPQASNNMQEHGPISQVISFKAFDQRDLERGEEQGRRRLPSIDALSPTNITMFSNWIETCKSHHPQCQVKENSWLPTRLLDVGSSDGANLPCLVETSSGQIRGSYTALSHMWGDMSHRPPLRTLTSNYENLREGIPISSLPKNFEHAMIVTRHLGIQYLWIDSLCIIQDSSEDWKMEAATMHQVYQYALVTIVATSAVSTHDGFLDRTLCTIPAAKIEYVDEYLPGGTATMILAVQDNQESGNWSGDIEGSTWNTRGWTMQERGLSARSIHFCRNKTYFECRYSRESEENEKFKDYRSFSLWPRTETWLQDQGTTESISRRTEMLYALWNRAVTNYTQRKLTKGSDMLPAIQSTAAEMATHIDDTYLEYAGMWLKNLRRDLLWQVIDGPTARPDSYRAPTWSWASVNAKVHWKNISVDSIEELLNMTSASFEVIDANCPLSNAATPQLRVKSVLQRLAFVDEVDDDDRWIYFSRVNFPYDLYIPKQTGPGAAQPQHINSFATFAERDAAIDDGNVVKFAEGRLDLDNKDNLTVSSRQFFYLHIDHTSMPSGLILESAGYFYKRVGVASIFAESGRTLIHSQSYLEETDLPTVYII